MKIIDVDNYDRESVNDKLICENINTFYGKSIVDKLNEESKGLAETFYKLVEDSYTLYIFKP